MSTNKANIQQIQKYLRGELDAKAMHTLEKQAQDDPFLMEAIEGYETTGTDQQANFEDIKERFAERITPRRVIPWRTLSIAATLLIAVGCGLIFFNNKPKPETPHLAITKTILPPPIDEPYQAARNRDQVTGTITDPTGHTLAGVKVRVKGTKLTTLTDSSGHFSLPADKAKGTLNIAATGYDAKQVTIGQDKNLKVVLNETANELASVSVTAYVEDDKPANKTHPTIGWKAFRDYLRHNAFVETGETGLVKLAFTVSDDGNINGIRVTHGNNEALNQKAIDLVLNGPAWKGITKGEMRLKIQFRKPKET